jgi:hypothetical protein
MIDIILSFQQFPEEVLRRFEFVPAEEKKV